MEGEIYKDVTRGGVGRVPLDSRSDQMNQIGLAQKRCVREEILTASVGSNNTSDQKLNTCLKYKLSIYNLASSNSSYFAEYNYLKKGF